MKQKIKKIGDVIWVCFLIVAAIAYMVIGYAILDYLNIGADNS